MPKNNGWKMRRRLLACLLIFFAGPACAGEVVVTIKPLHSLVAAVAQGSTIAPKLLVDGKASLHDFSLKPSQAVMLKHADIVFYMGDNFEQFLAKILPQLPQHTKRIAMENVRGMTLYPLRAGEGTGPHDLHLWLSPENAKTMVTEIARVLSETYPAQQKIFEANAKKLEGKITALDNNLRPRMAKLAGKNFAVFHDAYQYFERYYGLSDVGAITLRPDAPPTANRLIGLRERIAQTHAACIFREPQFDARIVDNLMQGTGSKSAVLDPEGALIESGPDLYFTLMEHIAAGLETCLN